MSSGEQGAERREDSGGDKGEGGRKRRREAQLSREMDEAFGAEEEEVIRDEGRWGIGESPIGAGFFDFVSVVSDADMGSSSQQAVGVVTD